MAYQSTEIDLENVLLSDTTKATFKKLNDNATILENNAQAVDAQISELYTTKQPLDADLTAIAGLGDGATPVGLLKKTGANTWELDPTAYTTNTGTVTSVSAGTGLSIDGVATVNPTVKIADGYKLLTTSEYNTLDAGATAGSTAVQPSALGTAAAKDFTTSVTSDSTDLVTSGAVYTAIQNLPEPMIFKGTVGTGGTETSLPTANSTHEGWVYKVITAGTYASQAADVGDTFICANDGGTYKWVLVPSGDEEDTWRQINVNGSQFLDSGTSSGVVNFKNGGNITVTGSGHDITFGVASNYSIPSTSDQATWSAKQDALSTQTAYTTKGTSTKVPTITTNTLGQVTAITETDIAFPVVQSDLENYLPLTGGTLTSQTQNVPLYIRSGAASGSGITNSYIGFKIGPANTTYGYIGVDSSSKPIFKGMSGSPKEIALKEDVITDVQVNSTSVASSGVANIVTNTAYNSSSNKIATMSDISTAISNLSVKGSYTFAANDAGWSSTATNGVFTLTISTQTGASAVVGKIPFACFNENNEQVMATLSFNSSGHILVQAEAKFAGTVYAI